MLKVCIFCGKEFKTKPSQGQRCCSRSCGYKHSVVRNVGSCLQQRFVDLERLVQGLALMRLSVVRSSLLALCVVSYLRLCVRTGMCQSTVVVLVLADLSAWLSGLQLNS
jgi:hypothetical protein